MPIVRLEPERLAAGGLAASLLLGDESSRALFPPHSFAGAGNRKPSELLRGSPLPLDAFTCTGPEAQSKLRRLLDGRAVAVTTGQQPQLFGGPLYVLYKALSAIAAAAELEAESGMPCLAVFWVASDDHDWREVASVGLLDPTENHRTLELAAPAGWEGRSVGPAPLPRGTDSLATEFCSLLEDRPDGEPWTAGLRQSYTPGRPFSHAFADVLLSWMGNLPLAVLDSAHPSLRAAAVPFFRSVLEHHAEIERSLEQGTTLVEVAGYRPQLTYLAGAAPIFRDDGHGRKRLHAAQGGFRPAQSGPNLSMAQLLAELDATPMRFSPSAALRPVLESHLLPVADTVLGPGEIAYWAQLRPLFQALDVPMPRVRPRASWRVVEPRVERLLEKTGVGAEQLSDGGAMASAALVELRRPRRLMESLLTLEETAASDFAALEQATIADLPGLRSAVGKARSRVFAELGAFRKMVDSRTRELEKASVDQVRRAARHLYPDGVSQERALSPYVYLARYGDRFLSDVKLAHSNLTTLDADAVAGDSDEA